jgi:hypothetical protein
LWPPVQPRQTALSEAISAANFIVRSLRRGGRQACPCPPTARAKCLDCSMDTEPSCEASLRSLLRSVAKFLAADLLQRCCAIGRLSPAHCSVAAIGPYRAGLRMRVLRALISGVSASLRDRHRALRMHRAVRRLGRLRPFPVGKERARTLSFWPW